MGKARLQREAGSGCVVEVVVHAVDGGGGREIGLAILKSAFDGEPVLKRKNGPKGTEGVIFAEDIFHGRRGRADAVERDGLKAAVRALKVHAEYLYGAQVSELVATDLDTIVIRAMVGDVALGHQRKLARGEPAPVDRSDGREPTVGAPQRTERWKAAWTIVGWAFCRIT